MSTKLCATPRRKTDMQDVLTKLTTIVPGSRVRSYDFPGRLDCYIEGTVVTMGEIAEAHGFEAYEILVDRQIIERKPAKLPNKVGIRVFPPLNGTEGLFGRLNGVKIMLELKRIPNGSLSSQYNWKLGKQYTILNVMGPLLVVEVDGDIASIHPDHFYKV